MIRVKDIRTSGYQYSHVTISCYLGSHYLIRFCPDDHIINNDRGIAAVHQFTNTIDPAFRRVATSIRGAG